MRVVVGRLPLEQARKTKILEEIGLLSPSLVMCMEIYGTLYHHLFHMDCICGLTR